MNRPFKIIVGTCNEAKLNAVECAAQTVFDISSEVESYAAKSGVSDQPISLEEMYIGAKNRAVAALNSDDNADFGVGLEGGLSIFQNRWFDSGIVVAIDRGCNEGIGETIKLEIGTGIMKLIKNGMELSDALVEITGHNTTQTRDCFKALTDDKLSVIPAFTDATIAAFNRFVLPEFHI